MLNNRANIRYVRALYALGEEYGVGSQVYADMKMLRTMFAADTELRVLMGNPTISKSLKHEALMLIFEGKVDSLSLRFLNLLIFKNRETNIDFIAREYIHVYAQLNNISRVEVQTAQPLSKEQQEEICCKAKAWGASDVELLAKVNPELIGGLILRVDGRYVDLSVRGRLRILEKKLNTTVYQKK